MKLSNLIIGLIVAVVIGIGATVAPSSAQSKNEIVLTEDNYIAFSGKVDAQSVARTQVKLADLSARISNNATIYLIIDSPGGSVMAGNQFIDFAQSLPQKIKTISIFAASMGYHMSQSFDERLVIPSSSLMSHRASLGGIGGQIPGELDSRLNNIKSILREMDVFVAKRIGISLEAYTKLIHNELWLTGREAVELKHADRLVKVVCSKELMSGSFIETFNTMFGPIQAELSNCPLITGPLSVKFGREVSQQIQDSVPKELVMKEIMKVRRGVVMEF